MSDTISQITGTTGSMVDTIKSGGSGGWNATKIIIILVALGVVGYIFYTIFGGFMSSMSEIFGDTAAFLGSIEKDMEDCLKGSWVCITLLFAIIAWPFAKLASYIYKNPSKVASDAELEVMDSLSDLSKKTYDNLQDKQGDIDDAAEENDYSTEGRELLEQEVSVKFVENESIKAMNETQMSQTAKQTKAEQASADATDLNTATANENDIDADTADNIGEDAGIIEPVTVIPD